MDDHSNDDLYPAESSACQVSRASLIRNDIWDYVYDADDDDDQESPAYVPYHHGSVGKASVPRNLLEADLLAPDEEDICDENVQGIDDTDNNLDEGVDLSDLIDIDIGNSSSSSSSCEQTSRSPIYPVVSSAMLYANMAGNNKVPNVAAKEDDDQRDNADANEQTRAKDQLVERKVDKENSSVKSWNAGDDGAAVSPTYQPTTERLDQLSADVTHGVKDAAASAQSYSPVCAHHDAADESLSDSPSVPLLDDISEDFQPPSSEFLQYDDLPSSTDAIIAYYFNGSDSSDSDELIDVFRTSSSLSPSPLLSPPASPPHFDQIPPFLPETLSAEDQEPPRDQHEEVSMRVPEVLLTPTGAGQARQGTGSTTTRVSSVRSVSSGSSHTSYENAATYQSVIQGFQPLAHGQTSLNYETLATSADVLHVERTRPSSRRRVFSTISTNQIPERLGHNPINSDDDKDHACAKGTATNLSEEQTPTATKPHLTESLSPDNETIVSTRLSASSSPTTSDEEKENRSPVILLSGDISMGSSTFGSLRNRRIRPGGGGAIGPTSPFAAVTLKSVGPHSHERNSLSSPAARPGEVKNKESAYMSAIRRASDHWRQQLIDGSLSRILQHAKGTISVTTHSDRIHDLRVWLSEYIDVVTGLSSALVIVGAILVGVLSFVDDTGRDLFGVRTRIYECALQSTVYRDVHECLVLRRLPSIFPLFGITVSSPVLHWFILLDLYVWSVLAFCATAPILIVVSGLALLSVGYGALAVLILSERFLRWILGMTKRLMLEQIAAAGTIADIIDGTDQKLFGDL
ncbi:hypothetical protein V1525DRAFT_414617 [Lipomyces kononenkoae]|uniref:Uncharacterized protein n=1 Tax=Lipomyces kononenkoae TaxID=34357 RepID=A0ACC3SRH8_LIPKO